MVNCLPGFVLISLLNYLDYCFRLVIKKVPTYLIVITLSFLAFSCFCLSVREKSILLLGQAYYISPAIITETTTNSIMPIS